MFVDLKVRLVSLADTIVSSALACIPFDVGICFKANRAYFLSCEFNLLLGRREHMGVAEGLAATLHAILIPRRASAMRVWVGATVTRPRSLTG